MKGVPVPVYVVSLILVASGAAVAAGGATLGPGGSITVTCSQSLPQREIDCMRTQNPNHCFKQQSEKADAEARKAREIPRHELFSNFRKAEDPGGYARILAPAATNAVPRAMGNLKPIDDATERREKMEACSKRGRQPGSCD